MTEETGPQQSRPARSPQAIKSQIEAQLKDAKVKAFQGELRKKIEELQSLEKVFRAKEAEVNDFMEENAELFA